MTPGPLLAAIAAGVFIALVPMPATADGWASVGLRLAGGQSGFVGPYAVSSWNAPCRSDWRRARGPRGVMTNVVVTPAGTVKLITTRRGRLVDIDRIGHLGPRGHWAHRPGYPRRYRGPWAGWHVARWHVPPGLDDQRWRGAHRFDRPRHWIARRPDLRHDGDRHLTPTLGIPLDDRPVQSRRTPGPRADRQGGVTGRLSGNLVRGRVVYDSASPQ